MAGKTLKKIGKKALKLKAVPTKIGKAIAPGLKRGGPDNTSAQGHLRQFRNVVKGPSKGGRR